MTRLLGLLPVTALLILAGAGAGCELVKNTGQVCLVPKNVQCTCENGTDGLDEDYECGLPSEYYTQDFDCDGTYPADVSYEIDARLYTGGNGYAVKETCKVTVDGERLRVKAKFWHKAEQDAIVEPPAYTTCEVGPLAAGTYVLEYGDNQAEVEIGDDSTVQPMVCVESTMQHDGYAGE